MKNEKWTILKNRISGFMRWAGVSVKKKIEETRLPRFNLILWTPKISTAGEYCEYRGLKTQN